MTYYALKENPNGTFSTELPNSRRSKYLYKWHIESLREAQPGVYERADPWDDVTFEDGPAYQTAVFHDRKTAEAVSATVVNFISKRDGNDY